MPLKLTSLNDGHVIELRATGKLTTDDYDRFLPEMERAIARHGSISVLFILENFHGWTAGALWEDLKFDVKHVRDVDRLAIVGDKKWQENMATFSKPFTKAEVKYFERAKEDEATAWVVEGSAKTVAKT